MTAPGLRAGAALLLLAASAFASPARAADESPADEVAVPAAAADETSSASMAQRLQGESGINVQTMCTNCNSADLTLGSFGNEWVSMVCDGLPVPPGLAQIYLLSVVPPTVIDNVAVEKGAGRVAVPAADVGGEIDVRRAAPPEGLRLNAAVDIGDYGWRGARADLGGRVGWFGASLVATSADSDLVDADRDGNPDMAAIDRTTVEGRFDLRPAAGHRLRLGVTSYDESQHDGRASYDFLSSLVEGRAIWNHENVEIDREQYDLHYEAELPHDSRLSFGYLWSDRSTLIDETQFIAIFPEFERTYDIHQRQEHFNLAWSRALGRRVQFRAGLSQTRSRYSIVDYRFNAARPFLLPPDHAEHESQTEQGAWVEGELQLPHAVELFLGLRRAVYRATDEEANPAWQGLPLPEEQAWLPRGALAWKPVDPLHLRLSFGYGRRQPPPTYEEVCCGRRYRNNRGIRVEHSSTLGLELTYQPAPEIQVGVSAFRSRFEDRAVRMVTQSAQYQPVYQNVNIPRSRMDSVSVEGRFKLLPSITLRSSASYTDARNTTEDDAIPALVEFSFMPLEVTFYSAEIPYVPRHSATIGLELRPGARTTLDFSAQFTGQMTIQQFDAQQFDPNTGGDLVQFVYTPSFWVGNVRAAWELRHGVGLFLGVDNVTDYLQTDLADRSTDYTWGPLRGRYVYGGVSYALQRARR